MSLLLCEGEERLKQRLEELEVEGVGSVGFGVGGVVVDFKKEAVDAGGDGGAGEERNELRLAAADTVGRGGLLHGVRAVKDDRGQRAHDGERAEIDDQIVVAEAGAALGEKDAPVAGGANFFDGVGHVPGGDELALLNIDGAPGFSGGDEQVGLAAEEGGDLEDVDGFGGDFAVGGLVDVGEDGKAGFAGEAAEDARALEKAGAAKAFDAGAVGLVVAGFEDEGDAEVGGDALQGVGHGADVGFAFDDAGAGDEEEPARANLHRADFKRVAHEGDFTLPDVARMLFDRSSCERQLLGMGARPLPESALKGMEGGGGGKTALRLDDARTRRDG